MFQTSVGTILVGGNNGSGIIRSTDGGTSWTAAGALSGTTFVTAFYEDAEGALYAGTSPNGDVFKSTDDGVTWTNTADLVGATGVRSLTSCGDGAIYAGTLGVPAVYRTSDGGDSWEVVGDLSGATGVWATTCNADGALYAGTSNGDGGSVYKCWPVGSAQEPVRIRDGRDRIWVAPASVSSDFVLTVRESTVASVEGGTSTFDVEVLSQKGYTGTVSLDAVGLDAAESYAFDPPAVAVPGHSTLTVVWDPLADAPVGSPIEDAFEIAATEVPGASASIKTVDVLGVVIDPADEYLTQFVYPAAPIAGHETEVFGRLAPAQSGQMVTVTTGSTLDVFTATTDESGFFSLTVPVAAAGAVSFTSATTGASTAPYQTEASRGRRSIRMTATTADGQFDPSDLVTIDGEIDPSPGVGEIYLAIRNPDDTYAFKGHVSVDAYGTFHQSFYAQEGVTEVEAELPGDADYYNASARLNVPVNVPIGMALVVAGGGESGNPLWTATDTLCDRAYNVYKGRLIPEDRILYLHPDASRDPDGDGTPEVSASPTKANLQSAIETWASDLVDVSTTYAPFKTPLTIYIVGVETTPGVIQLNDTETLTAVELAGYLDTFLANVQARYTDPEIPAPSSVPVNVVLEFAESGAFVDELAACNRIIVTSTGDTSIGFPGTNIISPDGTLAFSRYFYDEIDQGKYIATGWATGAEQMLMESWYSQWPLIESNGNGVPNEETDQIGGDGAGDKVLEYRDTYERRPAIDAMFSGLTITPDDDGTGLLWAKILDYGEFIDRVKCVILPPDDSGEPMREYRMHWNASVSRYELNHDGFRHRGLYKILITAVDEDEGRGAAVGVAGGCARGHAGRGRDAAGGRHRRLHDGAGRPGVPVVDGVDLVRRRRILCIHKTVRRGLRHGRLRGQRRPLHGRGLDQRRGIYLQDHGD